MKCFFVSSVPSKIGEEQSAEDAEDGPPELLVSDRPIIHNYDLYLLSRVVEMSTFPKIPWISSLFFQNSRNPGKTMTFLGKLPVLQPYP